MKAEKIRNLPDVEAVSRGNMAPMGTDKGVFSIRYYPRSDENIIVNAIKADDHYLDLYGIKLLAGRNIYPSDTIKEILINETGISQGHTQKGFQKYVHQILLYLLTPCVLHQLLGLQSSRKNRCGPR